MGVAVTKNVNALESLKSMFNQWKNTFQTENVLTYEGNIVSEQWMKDFLSIPKKYRVNPFDISPSGDVYYADKRNVEELNRRLEENKIEKKKGNYIKLNKGQNIWDLV